MQMLSRRQAMGHLGRMATLWVPCCLAACTERIVRVTHVVQVEREVTKVVTAIVRETVIVEETQLVERTVEKVVTASPAPKPRAIIVADLTDYGWTQFVMLMSSAFQEAFPNTVIRWRSLLSWDRYPARIAAQQAAGTQADLLEAPVGSLLQQWLSQGITQPLDDLVEAAQLDTSDILGGVLRACRGSLGLAGVPLIGHAGDNILYYNRAILENAGVGLPGPDWVLDDLQAVARSVTRDSDDDGQLDIFGLGLQADLPSAYPALRTFGGRLISADGRRCEASRPEALAYLRWVAAALADEAPFAPRPWQVVRGLYAMFLGGQVAMMRGSLNLAIQVARLGREALQVGSVLFPRRTADAVRGGVATGIAYAIAAGSAVASEVTQWIKLVSSREMGVQMLLGGYAEPGCRKSAWTDKRVLQRFPVASLVAEAADKAEPEELPWNYAMAPCLAAWNDCVGQLVGSDLDPATCATRICSAIDSILDQPMSSIAAP